MCCPQATIIDRLLGLDTILPGVSKGSLLTADEVAELGFEEMELEDDEGMIPPQGILPRKTTLRKRLEEQPQHGHHQKDLFFRCMRNPFKHMTLQGQGPQQFDVLLHLYLPVSDTNSVESMELFDMEEEVACNILDMSAEVLINDVSLWRLTDFKVTLRAESLILAGLPDDCADLLLEMASAGASAAPAIAYSRQTFFYSGGDGGNSVAKKLLSKGLVEKAGDPHGQNYWITATGASTLMAVQVVGPKQTLADYQRSLCSTLFTVTEFIVFCHWFLEASNVSVEMWCGNLIIDGTC